jgi:hypothetical protein
MCLIENKYTLYEIWNTSGPINLSTTCYLIWSIKPYLSISTLKISYHSLFHSVMSYGIMFWGNSSHSSVIFKMHKRVIRIIMGYGYRESCRELFKELKISTLSSHYIFSLLLLVVNNRDYFVTNIITLIYIGFKMFFYIVRHLDSIVSYLPTSLHLSFFCSWPSLYLPSSFSLVFLVLFCFGIHFNAVLGNHNNTR